VRSYIEDHPNATDAEVAEAVDWDVTRRTVNRWRNQMFDDDEGPDNGIEQASLLGAGQADADQSSQVAKAAADGDETATDALTEAGTTTAEEASTAHSIKKGEERDEEKRKQREQNRQKFQRKVEANDAVTIHQGDFTDVLKEYDDESIDHIVTDPPYPEQFLPLWDALAESADRVWKPGGFCVTYSGKSHLPEVMARLGESLEYYWQAILTQPGATAKFWATNMRTQYKPILIYAKPPVNAQDDFVTDIWENESREKDDHEWQQGIMGVVEAIERFTEPNDVILDPMAGAGTTAIACLETDRQCVVIDKDGDAVDTIHERVGEYL